jgi:glucokinase
MKIFLGVDIGGTNIKIAAVRPNGQVRARGVIDTHPEEKPGKAFRRIKAVLPALVGQGGEIAAAGVGCAGLVDPDKGKLYSSPNLVVWENSPLKRIAEDTFGVYTIVDNDANSAAYGEFRCGASRGKNDLVFITLGTGVGGGVVCGGRLLRGTANYAGELGHMAISLGGPKCHCGRRGCLEAYVGSYGLVRSARETLKHKKGRVLEKLVKEQKKKLTPALIAYAARRGDAAAKSVIKTAGENLGAGIASLINLFNPGVVALGGGVSGAFDLLLPHVEKTVKKQAFAKSARLARIVKSALGNDATAVGAAMLAKDNLPGRK